MKKLLLMLAGLLTLASCDKSHEPDFALQMHEAKSATDQSTTKRTIEEVQALALGVTTQLRSGGMRSATPLYISSTRPIERAVGGFRSLSEGATDVYVVQFADAQGYALVSANRGDDGVLYVADSGEFDPEFYDALLEAPIQRYMALSALGYRPPRPEDGGDDGDDWIYEPIMCPVGCRDLNNCPHIFTLAPDPMPKGEVVRGKDNLLQTNWYLDYPFNHKVPEVEYLKDKTDEYGNVIGKVWDKAKAFIGCNAVAALQILAYYQYPRRIGEYYVPWKRFCKMDEFEGDDIELISSVAKYVADQIYSRYGVNNSRDTYAYGSDLHDFLVRIGYNAYEMVKYDFNLVTKELDEDRPLFIRASIKGESAGHIWIIDGYKVMSYSYRSGLNLVHCNWGWGKDANKGYCVSGLWSDELSVKKPEYPFIPRRTEKTKVYSEYCRISIGLEPK